MKAENGFLPYDIFVFSGSNNGTFFAQEVKKQLGGNIYQIPLVTTKQNVYEGKRMLVIYPTYAYGIPRIVKHFLKHNTFNYEYRAIITSYGTRTGGSLLEAKKYCFDYYHSYQSIENFIPLFGNVKDLNAKYETELASINHLINELRDMKLRPIKGFHFLKPVSLIFYYGRPLVTKLIRNTKDCTKCGLCLKECPTKAIFFKQGKIKISSRYCELCNRCLNVCQFHGLKFLKHNKRAKTYLHR
ncbi:MAG: 4Fe-4S dicluster domain-containing protein [Erysipelotrichaceae bacterium]|jgi:ferredoxin|nr:4Fe-4S dicluster domain-containing protein [Erysipelotrichaceae bacterium]